MLTEISTVNETSRSKSYDTVNTDYRVAVSKLDTAVLYRITAIAFRHRVRMAIAIGSTIVASVFQLYIPQYLGQAVDQAQGLLAGAAAGISERAETEAALFTTAILLLVAAVGRGATGSAAPATRSAKCGDTASE